MRHNIKTINFPAHNLTDLKKTQNNSIYSLALDYWQECKHYLRIHIPDYLYQSIIEPLILNIISTKDIKNQAPPLELEFIAPEYKIAQRVSERYLTMIQDFFNNTPLAGQVIFKIHDTMPSLKQEASNQTRDSIKWRENSQNKIDMRPSLLSQTQKKIIQNKINLLGQVSTIKQVPPIHADNLSTSKTSMNIREEDKTLGIINHKTDHKIDYKILFKNVNFCIPEVNQQQVQQLFHKKGIISYISGSTGSGKSTIASIIAQYKEKLGLRSRVLRFQNFVSDLVNVAQSRDSTSWRKRMQSYDCLILDDFQYIKPKAIRSQEEISYLIDDYIEKSKLIIFCTDKPIENLSLTPSLYSRLKAGYNISLSSPKQSERRNILKDELANIKFSIENKYLDYLSSYITKDMRSLKTAARRLKELYTFHPDSIQKNMDTLLIDRTCGDLYYKFTELSADDILKAVSAFYDISPKALQGPSRDKKYTIARHLVAYLCVNNLKMSLKDTAQVIGRSDHSSVIYARNKVAKLMQNDLFFRRQIQEVLKKVQTEG